MSIPKELKYTKEHEWIRLDGTKGAVGITHHAADQLGDIVYLDLPHAGRAVTAGETFMTVESVKAVSDIYAPVSGTIASVNRALADKPELVNSDPYGAGWIVEIALTTPAEAAGLLDDRAYAGLIGSH